MAPNQERRGRQAATTALVFAALLLLSAPAPAAASCDRSSLDSVDAGWTKYLVYEADVSSRTPSPRRAALRRALGGTDAPAHQQAHT